MKTAELDAHIAATVASWPSPTPEMVRRVVQVLYPELSRPSCAVVESPAVIAEREARNHLDKVRKQFSEAMTGCRACGVPRAGHKVQESYGTGYHTFEALTPEDSIKVAKSYQKKIAAAERALESARA